jgi:DNA modification methylase
MTATDYYKSLERKIVVVERHGIEVLDSELHPDNKGHQNAFVKWALSIGRALISGSFGLGKTRVQCQIALILVTRFGGKFLLVCPLGVKTQFVEEDGPEMGMTWQYVRSDAEIEKAETPFLITNYERVRDGDIDPRKHNFIGASLDEGSILRNLGSKTVTIFTEVFNQIPYRFVATATPAPNDYIELNQYADWLEIMDRGQILTRWFKRDSQHAGHLTLYQQHEEEYWLWVASWSLFVYRPSDLGYSDDGYELPKLNVHWHRIAVDQSRAWAQTDDRGQRRLILDAAGGVSEACEEKRATIPDRILKMLEIVGEQGPQEHWLIWHDLEDERRAVEKALPDAVSVYGSQDLEAREQRILDFSHGRIRILSTKPRVAGSGCNFQYHCHRAIFLGIGYKFQDFIQAIHRLYRFMQDRPVDIHIIYAESEDEVVRVLQHKWAQHNKLVARMEAIVKKYGLVDTALRRDLARSIGVKRMEVKGKLFTAINNDCVLETRRMATNSVDLIHTSIPFGNHYEYTTHLEDFGHNPSDAQFWEQMDYLIPELLRILKPGRVAAVHVKDRQLYGHQTPSGIMETAPFSDECVMAFRKHGWTYQGRRTVVTDVVRENNSTYRLGYTEMTKDASKMSQGLPEYILLFRKRPTSNTTARADDPVTKSKEDYSLGRWQVDAHSFWRSGGDRLMTPAELAQIPPENAGALFSVEQLNRAYDYERHVAIADALALRGRLPKDFMLLPPRVTRSMEDLVWDDVVSMRTLNSKQSQKRRENHICPLPFDIVERIIRLYSNPGDVVFDPFGGIGTVAYKAIEMHRLGLMCELNNEYFGHAASYCKEIEQQVMAPTLFDFAGMTATVSAD